MRFLVDQAVSWQVARDLTALGHDAVHTRDLALSQADDETILERARAEQRVIITQDTDFGGLLAMSGAAYPSVILIRMRDGRPAAQARALAENLPRLESDLQQGAVVVVQDEAIRIRRLPIRR